MEREVALTIRKKEGTPITIIIIAMNTERNYLPHSCVCVLLTHTHTATLESKLFHIIYDFDVIVVAGGAVASARNTQRL